MKKTTRRKIDAAFERGLLREQVDHALRSNMSEVVIASAAAGKIPVNGVLGAIQDMYDVLDEVWLEYPNLPTPSGN